MNKKAQRVLEYDKIIEMLTAQASSEMTKRFISGVKPLRGISEIRENLAETTEAARIIARKGPAPLGAFYDIEGSVRFAEKGGTLTMRQLLQILYNLKSARACSVFLKNDAEDCPAVLGIAEVIAVVRALEDDIERCIISEDEMSDSASTELKNIRRSIVRQNENIRARINQILNSQENRTLLQDAIVTMRGGRYVIPVKQEHRARFPGIVHDQSQSGATLFIEPQVIVNLNNELRELELAEKAEIERILAELSGDVSAHAAEIINNQKLLVKLDFIFAKGKLSKLMDGEPPEMNEEGVLELKGARHPLIDAAKVVPVSLEIGKSYSTLVITGPNTGGKTVTLKTVGLTAMMAQSGLHIAANPGSKLPVFKNIFADIGDEQSIEQSLSTFSSHMNNIVYITKKAGKDTLVLVDELGSGTDPTEGAALAVSVLDFLKSAGALTFATTHYNELKKYAISTDGVMNASMQFDVETLSPTYKLLVGAPGRSNAFEISEKLGLPAAIIARARGLIESGDLEFEDVVSAIERDRREAEAERDEALMLKIETQKQKAEIDKLQARLAEQKEKILSSAREEARQLVREAREVSREVTAELKELSKVESLGERTRRLDESRSRLRAASAKYREKVSAADTDFEPVDPAKLFIGHRVKVMTIGQNGEVLTLPDSKGDLLVQVGIMKINANVKDLMSIEQGKGRSAGSAGKGLKRRGPAGAGFGPAGGSSSGSAGGSGKGSQFGASGAGSGSGTGYGALYRSKVMSVPLTINVQGENLDSAVADVDKYLDDAFMAGLEEVTVIHGRGEGILKNGIAQLLRRHKHVDSFRRGAYNEGGDGVTVVRLKK